LSPGIFQIFDFCSSGVVIDSHFHMLEQIIKFNANTKKEHQRFGSKSSSGYNTTNTHKSNTHYIMLKIRNECVKWWIDDFYESASEENQTDAKKQWVIIKIIVNSREISTVLFLLTQLSFWWIKYNSAFNKILQLSQSTSCFESYTCLNQAVLFQLWPVKLSKSSFRTSRLCSLHRV